MPSIVDRFGQLISGAGDTMRRIGMAISPQGPPGASGGTSMVHPANNPATSAPSVDLPGVPHWNTGMGQNASPKLQEALKTVDAYFGRISYDAGPSWTRFSSQPATDLTPQKIIGAQNEARAGYPLRWAEMIEQVLTRDSHLSGIGQQRIDDVIKGSWRLTRWVNDDVAACVRNFCDEALRNIDEFEDGLAWLLWGNAYSYNADEVIWQERKFTFPGAKGETIGPIDVIVPARLDPVHAKHFRFDLRTDEPLLWLGSDQVSLPFGKFVFYRGEGQHPITELRGYMWQCIWLSMFKSIAWSGWSVYVDRFGLPTPLIRYGDVAQYSEHKSLFEDMLKNLGQGIGAIIPDDVKTDLLWATQGGKSGDPHSALSDACEAAQSVRVLGATLTAKIGNVGSFAASSSHMDVKYAKEEADARRAWSSLRSQLLAPIVFFNANSIADALRSAGYADSTPDAVRRRVPKGLHRVPREIDPVQRMSVIETAVNKLGMGVGQEALYDEFNISQPVSKEDRAPGEAKQVTSGGALIGSVEASTVGAVMPAPNQSPEKQKEPSASE